VDVLATPGAADDGAGGVPLPARLVARAALVLAVNGTGAAEGGDEGLLGSRPGTDRAPLVVLAVTEPQALAIAGAGASGGLAFTLARVDGPVAVS
jgi:Flp pilus assembly protein CpaB